MKCICFKISLDRWLSIKDIMFVSLIQKTFSFFLPAGTIFWPFPYCFLSNCAATNVTKHLKQKFLEVFSRNYNYSKSQATMYTFQDRDIPKNCICHSFFNSFWQQFKSNPKNDLKRMFRLSQYDGCPLTP